MDTVEVDSISKTLYQKEDKTRKDNIDCWEVYR